MNTKTCHNGLVFFGAFICIFCHASIPISLSVLLVDFLNHFQCTKLEAALVVSLSVGSSGCAGMLSSILVNRMTPRWSCLIGGIMTSCALLSSSFAPNIIFLMVFLGILTGVGLSLVRVANIQNLGENFGQKSGLVTPVVFMAQPLGVVVMPFVYKFLTDFYSWRGTLLILSGICLHTCVCFPAMGTPTGPAPTQDHTARGAKGRKFFHFSLLKKKIFIIEILQFMVLHSCYMVVLIVYVDAAIEKGFSRETGVLALTLNGIASVPTFAISVFLAKSAFLSNMAVLTLTGLVSGGSVFLLVFATSPEMFLCGVTVIGFFNGIKYSSISNIVLKTVGIKRYASAIGLLMTLSGSGVIVTGAIAGQIATVTGSYKSCLIFAGAVSFVYAVISHIFYQINACHSKRQRDNGEPGEVQTLEG